MYKHKKYIKYAEIALYFTRDVKDIYDRSYNSYSHIRHDQIIARMSDTVAANEKSQQKETSLPGRKTRIYVEGFVISKDSCIHS